MTKPSDALSLDDLDDIRHGRPPRNNGNDWKYKGKRSSNRLPLGGG